MSRSLRLRPLVTSRIRSRFCRRWVGSSRLLVLEDVDLADVLVAVGLVPLLVQADQADGGGVADASSRTRRADMPSFGGQSRRGRAAGRARPRASCGPPPACWPCCAPAAAPSPSSAARRAWPRGCAARSRSRTSRRGSGRRRRWRPSGRRRRREIRSSSSTPSGSRAQIRSALYLTSGRYRSTSRLRSSTVGRSRYSCQTA